ncbi:hypothetical protein ILUMI_05438 [Ignelater luminosus]|uniref:Reverse transcriptase domain-containing protein n=1 Tax=Ignelater luminosus TaxID=2038154 RepID=A0A8K0GK39_IGNLU|nr:hypothetical protein ILUMI_05438 [Ignelater luminosus]
MNQHNFGDIEGVVIYFDDLLFAVVDREQHDLILGRVVKSAREINVKLNESKIQFTASEVKYPGHKFNKFGTQQDANKTTLDKNVFIRVFKKLCETGTLPSANITSERTTTQGLEEVENILVLVEDDRITSSRRIATQFLKRE